ncbi:MAG: hypothetical protein HYW48_02370 [Deltaproteobacteria bacterium]|nr:hypothetical protein [Deltaproteobacteria bacterium]
MVFADLKQRLEEDLGTASSRKDLEHLIHSLSALMKEETYTEQERYEFKKIRQRAYDKRRNPKSLSNVPNLNPEHLETPQYVPNVPKPNPKHLKDPNPTAKGIRPIGLFPIMGLVAACIFVGCLLLEQTIPLYSSAKFPDPALASVGAIVVMIGFSAFHALSPSWLSMFLCVYVCVYEIGFVAFGTWKNEVVIARNEVEADATVLWLQEKVSKARGDYEEERARFENPESKVFKNGWFKSKIVNPTWQGYQEAQEKLARTIDHLEVERDLLDPVLMLKVAYRLALVFLAMLLVHLSVGLIRNKEGSRGTFVDGAPGFRLASYQ